MSHTKPSSSLWRWFGAGLMVALAIALWLNRYWIIDTIQVQLYDPPKEIAAIVDATTMTDKSEFYFYATHPELSGRTSFNEQCERKEADSPILGCYSLNRIYIFDVDDKRLAGIEEVTAAHEMLHAAYDRLPEDEKQRIETLLEKAYDDVVDDKLQKRMDYYAKTEPGQRLNELHSIIGTEYARIGNDLETYYKQYFTDRASLVELHQKVDEQFTKLSTRATDLAADIEQLANEIDQRTDTYNVAIRSLNNDIASFNARARRTAGFSSEAQFNAARDGLEARIAQLSRDKSAIEVSIATYEQKRKELSAIASASESLNRSLDSTLAETPSI